MLRLFFSKWQLISEHLWQQFMLLISRLRPIIQIGHRAILARDWSFSGMFNTSSLLIKKNCQILSTFFLICKEKLFIHKILIHVYCKNWKVFFSKSAPLSEFDTILTERYIPVQSETCIVALTVFISVRDWLDS